MADPTRKVVKLPLTDNQALEIIQDIALNYSRKVKISLHAKTRMKEREVTIRQIFTVLKSKYSVINELHQTPSGDWKFNLRGMGGHERPIVLTVALKEVENDPLAMIVTVMLGN